MKQFLRLSLLLSLVFLANQHLFSQQSSNTTLSTNNIRASISNIGNHFHYSGNPQYVVPKEGSASTIFSNALWVGGVDIAGQLRLAALRYRQVGDDYWPGTLGASGVSLGSIDLATVHAWNKFFRVTKEDILYFSNPNRAPSDIPTSILEWPAHGDTSAGQAFYLAPFHDVDKDGVYNPYKGDYPMIKGDECIFFIFNDKFSTHTESGGKPLGLEVHAMIYAFNDPDDEALNNTLFVNYKLINRSFNTYLDTYVGLWTDFDIGYANDDYIGCDVERSTYYGYNGTLIDGTGSATHYGENPPVQTLTIFGGPYMDADGYDNPSFKGNSHEIPSFAINYPNVCEIVTQHGDTMPFTWWSNEIGDYVTENLIVRAEAINGMNFGDGIKDNERFGMNTFLYHENHGSNPAINDPSIDADYYNYLRGIWKDSTKMQYGGNGHNQDIAPECNFMFPGISDPCNWGTNGIASAFIWTEESEGNAPWDRRGLAAMGPFTFEARAVHELDFAFITVFPKDTLSALERYGEVVDSIRTAFFRGTTASGEDFNTIVGIADYLKKNKENNIVKIFPNPTQSILYIQSLSTIEQVSIYDISGRMLKQINNVQESISINDLANGIYLVKVKTENGETVKKIVKQ